MAVRSKASFIPAVLVLGAGLLHLFVLHPQLELMRSKGGGFGFFSKGDGLIALTWVLDPSGEWRVIPHLTYPEIRSTVQWVSAVPVLDEDRMRRQAHTIGQLAFVSLDEPAAVFAHKALPAAPDYSWFARACEVDPSMVSMAVPFVPREVRIQTWRLEGRGFEHRQARLIRTVNHRVDSDL